MEGARFTGGSPHTAALVLDPKFTWPEFTEHLLCADSRVGRWDRARHGPGPTFWAYAGGVVRRPPEAQGCCLPFQPQSVKIPTFYM